jgi:hypothetical protein
VTGRALVFADPEVIRLVSREFIACTGDDWYQRRRDDAEGQFWRKVADQGPRKGAGGSTRQGIYCFTADGKLLAYKNAQDAGVMRDVFKKALAEFKKLPAEQRRPDAVTVEDAGKLDARYHRAPPENGLVVRVYTRVLDREGEGYCKGKCSQAGHDFPARDHLWLREREWKALIPAEPKKGAVIPVPEAVAVRICRFHLTDNTRGEPPHWTREQIRNQKFTLTVEEVSDSQVSLRLDGTALLADNADADRSSRGYDVRLAGTLVYDRAKKGLVRFDAVAVGEHWGEGTFTRGARPGRTPLGVCFELATGEQAADRVPPQGARTVSEYFGR